MVCDLCRVAYHVSCIMWRREAFVDGHEARAFCGVAGHWYTRKLGSIVLIHEGAGPVDDDARLC